MPAVAPSEPLINIAEQDVNLPTTGQPNKDIPSNTIQQIGWDDSQSVFGEDLNYVLNNFNKWIQYSQDRIDDLVAQIELERVSIGEIISITGDSTNPAILKGYGVWEATSQGRSLIGAGEGTDTRGESIIFTDGDTTGEYKHVQTVAEMATHAHNVSATTDNDSHEHTINMSDSSGTSFDACETGDPNVGAQGTQTTSQNTHNHAVNVSEDSVGNADPMNNIHPVQVVYFWKRTA